MTVPNRTHVSYLRGATRMVFEATAGAAAVVEKMHRTIQSRPPPLGHSATGRTSGITGLIYRGIDGGLRVVGKGIDAGFAAVGALLPEGESTPADEAFASAINGVYGDYLARTGNPLAVEMGLRYGGRHIDLADPAAVFSNERNAAPTGRLLVLVHGLCLTDRQWNRDGHDHGAALAGELGYTPLYLRYNSGLHVATNGRAFADVLDTVIRNWPKPVEEVTIIGHSMGGLVARSACHFGRESGHAWPEHVHKLVFLGTPHHGAPLERGGHWLDFALELSPYSAPFTQIGKMRSAGIRDLRHGTITSGAHKFVPLPTGVKCYAAAATIGLHRSVLSEQLLGDGLVPLDSALGRHADAVQTLAIPRDRQWIGYGMGHLALLSRPEVYAQLRAWLQEAR
jgi:pimeloyl-ACP methyl ester carboxylesterase